MTFLRNILKYPAHWIFALLLLPFGLVLLAGCDIDIQDALDANAQVSTASPTLTEVPATPTLLPTATNPTPTATVRPSDTPTPSPTTTPAPTDTPVPTTTPTPAPVDEVPTPVVIDGRSYDAYVPAATKKHQDFHYSCEFDAAWAVLATYGFDVSLADQLAIVGVDDSIEPYYEETADGFVVYGGDIIDHYSGNYKTNFLARTTGFAMQRVFEHYGLNVTPVRDRDSLEAALRRGELVWIKTTADFKPGKPVTWIMPDGRTYKTVLGNDHAAVVMGYNSDGVLIRDVLGPTSTNWDRKYQYEVPWKKFLAAWGSQQYDGLAVAPPAK